MRVLYFTQKDTPHDRRFLKALSGTTHQVFVLRQEVCQPETSPGVTELAWPSERPDWSDWAAWQAGSDQLSSLLEKIQPDLVHAGPVQGSAFLTALAGFHPLVTMSWGWDMLLKVNRSPWMRQATTFTLANTDIFLCDCQTVANEAVQFGFPRHRIEVFPWGVDLGHFSPGNGQAAGRQLRRALGWDDEFVVLCNRTWADPYGVDLLAEAFLGAAQKNLRLRLLLVGDGPQSKLIHDILAPVRARVAFPGWLDRDALPEIYNAADLFVSPSHCDGSSVSLLEALACGCPVLVSDIPSNREWVVPEEAGELFRDGDLNALQSQLLLMSKSVHLEAYGRRARRLAEERADWAQNFQICLQAYQRAIA